MTRLENQRGFTLIELVISLGIVAFMMMLAWQTTSAAIFTRKNLAFEQERDHELRVASSRMVRDLGSAYLSANEDQSAMERRTLFIGKTGGAVGELRFSTMAHEVLWADANESEQTVVTYMAEQDPDDRSITNLVRKELRRMPDPLESRSETPAEVDLLIRNVETVKFEYYDPRDKTWKDHWDSTQIDAERGRLPTRVRITIEVGIQRGDDEDTVKYITQARISMQEELKFFTN
ncbi:MAG TPA: type II secretion system protein GspJ [Kofleriaceae bacterium]|nr:type II secretion system protein GspJ [Kofleriaceae bacterium]